MALPEPTHTADAAHAIDRAHAVALVEQDRYCEHCGYNLHTQPVVRDERLDLLIIRCPECGRWHPALATHSAVKPWLQRIGTLVLFAWMLAIIVLASLVMLFMGIVSYGTIESLTTWDAVYSPTVTSTVDPLTGATVTQPAITAWRRVERTDFKEYWLFISLMTSLTVGLALLWALFTAVALHHWRRIALMVLAAIIPVLPALWVRQIWWWESPELLPVAQRYIAYHLLLAMLVGAAGVWVGRPLMRFAVVLLLPPRARAPLAFLWLADGKFPPVAGSANRASAD